MRSADARAKSTSRWFTIWRGGVWLLEGRVLLWVADHRTEEAVRPFFTKEMGRRRCQTLRVICMDMWAAYANLVKEHAPQAQILFDRFHIVKHLNEAVEEVRRSEMRRLTVPDAPGAHRKALCRSATTRIAPATAEIGRAHV